jgi:hypothetical protein
VDREQVRARILEVGKIVKEKLMAREKEQNISYGEDIEKRAGLWYKKRGYKYIDDAEYHINRFFQYFDMLNPAAGSSIFEIGTGQCYLLFICRELRGCRVAGVDWKYDDEDHEGKDPGKAPYRDLKKYAYHLFREQFGLEDVIRHFIVEGYKPTDFGGRYDTIIATRATFNRHWKEGEYRYWLKDCYEHLNPDGRLMIALNKVEPDALAALPCLRPAQATRENEKLNIIPREAIGRVLAGKS